jgi:hypothetical protein
MGTLHFKMEGVEEVAALAEPGSWGTSLDIKSAFNHLRVDGEANPKREGVLGGDCRYLCFRYSGKYWAYRMMPFGPAHSPYFFKKLMDPVARFIRQKWGVHMIIYVDDILLLDRDPGRLTHVTLSVALFLNSLGFLLSLGKCEVTPKSQVEFLGWRWDLVRGEISMRGDTREGVLRELKRWDRKCMGGRREPVGTVARLLGKLVALRPQLRGISLYLGGLYTAQTVGVRRHGWRGIMRLHPGMRKEVAPLRRMVEENVPWGYRPRVPGAILTTDASERGWGAILRVGEESFFMFGRFGHGNPPLSSSNQREAYGFWKGLIEYEALLEKRGVKALVGELDNMVTVTCIQRARAKGGQLRTIREIFSWMGRTGIRIYPMHRPGVCNAEADALSRLEVAGDYWVKWDPVQRLLNEWGKEVTVDMFATKANRKLRRYVSPSEDGEALWKDAFARSWEGEIPFLHPPPGAISRCLIRLRVEGVQAAVVTPK